MIKHTLPSGAVFDVTPLAYGRAWGVTQALLKVAEKLEIDVAGMDFKALAATDVLKFKGPLCTLLASEVMQAAAETCLERCTYNGVKITDQTFETDAGRGDYLIAAFYALKENVSPFFRAAISFLETK
jgi:hypothetical protein